MFRHSEIYSILRRRQLQKENREADAAPCDASFNDKLPSVGAEHAFEDAGDDLDVSHHDYEIDTTNRTTTKQRREACSENETRDSVDSRRHIRELDATATDYDGSLDYGEDFCRNKDHAAAAESLTRTQINYVDYDDREYPLQSTKTQSPKQGRKIWWPSIG